MNNEKKSITGVWSGVLAIGGMEMMLVVHINQDDTGALCATADCPEHGMMGLPVDEILFNGDMLNFEIRGIHLTYQGVLNKDNAKFEGTVTKGKAVPFVLKRGTLSKEHKKRPQEPTLPVPYREEEVCFENKAAEVMLSGTLTLPLKQKQAPAVVLIPCAGPVERDASLYGHKPFLVLADHLTRQGIAVLRFDKRGIGKSTGSFETATSIDFAADVLVGINYLKTRNDIAKKQIGLIGHGEGGYIASVAAAQSKDCAFAILMAGTGVNGERQIREQSAIKHKACSADMDIVAWGENMQAQLFGIVKREPDVIMAEKQLREYVAQHLNAISDAQKKAFETIFAMEYNEANLNMLVTVVNSPSFRHWLVSDPAAELKKVSVPVLALNGELDQWVPAKLNLAGIANALKTGGNGDYMTLELPNLNHHFQTCQPGMTEPANIEETLAPSVLKVISDWIKARTGMNSQQFQQKSGAFKAQDKTGAPVILEWMKTDMISPEFVEAMKSVWDIACPTYTKVEVDFLRAHPEVVGKEAYYKSFEPLFKDGVASVDWQKVEEKMQEILKQYYVLDVSTFSDEMKKAFSRAEHFFVSIKNEHTDELLGYISFLILPEYAVGDVKCMGFAVKPEEQNRGLGRLLMSSILRIIPDLKRIFQNPRITNVVAQRAYYNWGFTKAANPVTKELNYEINPNHFIQIPRIPQGSSSLGMNGYQH